MKKVIVCRTSADIVVGAAGADAVGAGVGVGGGDCVRWRLMSCGHDECAHATLLLNGCEIFCNFVLAEARGQFQCRSVDD